MEYLSENTVQFSSDLLELFEDHIIKTSAGVTEEHGKNEDLVTVISTPYSYISPNDDGDSIIKEKTIEQSI